MPCNSYVCMLYGICYYYTLYDDDLPFGSLLSCNSTVGKENELNNSRTTSSSSDSEENFTDSDDNLSIDYSPISSSEPENNSALSDNTTDINNDLEVTEPNEFQHTHDIFSGSVFINHSSVIN